MSKNKRILELELEVALLDRMLKVYTEHLLTSGQKIDTRDARIHRPKEAESSKTEDLLRVHAGLIQDLWDGLDTVIWGRKTKMTESIEAQNRHRV